MIYVDLRDLLGDSFSISFSSPKKPLLKNLYKNEKEHGKKEVIINCVNESRYAIRLSYLPNEMAATYYLKPLIPSSIDASSFLTSKNIHRRSTNLKKSEVTELMNGFKNNEQLLLIGLCNSKFYFCKYYKEELEELENTGVFFGQDDFFNNNRILVFRKELQNQQLNNYEMSNEKKHTFFRLVYLYFFVFKLAIEKLGIYKNEKKFFITAKINFKNIPVYIFEEIEMIKPGEFFLGKDEILPAINDLGI